MLELLLAMSIEQSIPAATAPRLIATRLNSGSSAIGDQARKCKNGIL